MNERLKKMGWKVVEGVATIGILSLLSFAILAIRVGPAKAILYADQIYNGQAFNFLNAGTVAWQLSTNQSNVLTLNDNNAAAAAGVGAAQILIEPNTGGLVLPKYAKTVIDTLTPNVVGELIIDTNGTLANQVCISTATTLGSYRALQGAAALGCGSNN